MNPTVGLSAIRVLLPLSPAGWPLTRTPKESRSRGRMMLCHGRLKGPAVLHQSKPTQELRAFSKVLKTQAALVVDREVYAAKPPAVIQLRQRFEVIGMDLVSLLPKSGRGKKYILVFPFLITPPTTLRLFSTSKAVA
ncbi:hypothetical protein AOLI_G00201060 [Acnodon oligacanthus]